MKDEGGKIDGFRGFVFILHTSTFILRLTLNFDRSPLICSPMKAKVIVMPKQSVLDPQGVAVRNAVNHHGMPEVKSVRIGKFMEIELEGAQDEKKLHEICRDLLSNPVIEDYQLIIEG